MRQGRTQNRIKRLQAKRIKIPTPKNTTTPLLSLSPFDVQNMPSDVDTNDLRRKFPIGRSKGKNASCTACFRTNFETHDSAGAAAVQVRERIVARRRGRASSEWSCRSSCMATTDVPFPKTRNLFPKNLGIGPV